MGILNLSRFALSICAAVILFAGCGGGSQLPIGQLTNGKQVSHKVATQKSAAQRFLSLYGEMFTATGVRRDCHTNGQNYTKVIFKAYGYATGPLPGTFSTHGHGIGYYAQGYHLNFRERFTIISSSRHLSGVATSYSFTIGCRPTILDVTANYSINKHRKRDYGTTSVTLDNRSFSETFQ